MTNLLEQLSIVEAAAVSECWHFVGGAAALVMLVVTLVSFMRASGGFAAVERLRKTARNHPVQTSVLAPMFLALAVYAAEKSVVIVPRTEECDYRQSAAAIVSGTVEYYRSTSSTNVPVALFGGTVTQELSFVAGDFLYAYDISYGGGPLQPAQSPFWVRDAQSNEWTKAIQRSVLVTNSTKAAVVAYLDPSTSAYGSDPSDYRYWFIGPQERLPEVIIEGGVGIVIDQRIITADSVYVSFHPDDQYLVQHSVLYVLQCRVSRDGVLGEWQTIASVTSSGSAGSSFTVPGYTVGEYREYRVYADKEVSE